MSILRHKALPNPQGSLSHFIPTNVIANANEKVQKEVNKATCRKKSGRKYNVFTPKECAELGKLACQIGSTATASRFSSKLSITINESTVGGIKKAYVNERSGRARDDENIVIEELPPKKRDRPLLGASLDNVVQQYILKLRQRRCLVNMTIVSAAAK